MLVGVYAGVCNARCLRVRIDTLKYGTVFFDVYLGVLKPGLEGVDACELSFRDLDLGDFHKTFDPTTDTHGFQVALPRPGKFAILMLAEEVNVDGGQLYVNHKIDGTGRDGSTLNIPCDGKPYVKVSEVLTKEDARNGLRTMHYECTTVESEEGRLMELERDGDKDLLTLVCSVHFEERAVCTVRSKGGGAMRGGAMRGGAAGPVQHEVAIHESTTEAKQSTKACHSHAVSPEHRLKFRVYAKTLEKGDVEASAVGSPPKVRRL